MARTTGRIGAADLSAGTHTTIFTVPTGEPGTVKVTVAVCNRNDKDSVKIRLAVLDGAIGTLSDEDYIEYNVEIKPNGVLQRQGLLMAVGDVLGAYSNRSNVTVQAWGEK